ncbi:MAG: alpha/beta fold hydrolase [Streptosporangiaceae bacterium]
MTQTHRGRALARGAVLCPRPRAGAELRLFLFHHAGGSHLLYKGWEQEFPDEVEICLLDAPGRGRLHGQPLLDNSTDLVDFFRDTLLPWTGRPFAFFGHSMGALIAYELTLRLAAAGEATPVWLGLSACAAPQRTSTGTHRVDRRFTEDELRGWLRSAGDTPEALLDDASLWRIFGPIFRSDFALAGSWRPDPAAEPLAVPMSVFGGEEDRTVSREQLAAWASRTEHFLGLHLYRGGHFYLTGHRRRVARQIAVSSALTLSARKGFT